MLPAVLSPYAGDASQLQIDADTVGQLLERIGTEHPLLHARLD